MNLSIQQNSQKNCQSLATAFGSLSFVQLSAVFHYFVGKCSPLTPSLSLSLSLLSAVESQIKPSLPLCRPFSPVNAITHLSFITKVTTKYFKGIVE